MPSPNSFRNIVREHFNSAPVSSSLQIAVLENLCDILRRNLDKVTLGTLGGIACLDDGYGMCHGISLDQPFVHSFSDWSLQTQGIFAGTPFARKMPYGPGDKAMYPDGDGVYRTFGLARSGEWLFIKIDYLSVVQHGKKYHYQQALRVRVIESNLTDIIEKTGISLESIFLFLTLTVRDWAHSRKRLYEDATDLEKLMDSEFELFSMINK